MEFAIIFLTVWSVIVTVLLVFAIRGWKQTINLNARILKESKECLNLASEINSTNIKLVKRVKELEEELAEKEKAI